jgi:hypothetical protein
MYKERIKECKIRWRVELKSKVRWKVKQSEIKILRM